MGKRLSKRHVFGKKIEESPPDPIIRALQEFTDDTRKRKINAGIGMIIDPATNSPFVPGVVREIGQKIAFCDVGYLPVSGHIGYLESHARELVFGRQLWSTFVRKRGQRPDSIVWAQTMGGTSALSLAKAIILRFLASNKRILLLDPGWPNHPKIYAGFKIVNYVHENPQTRMYDHKLYIKKLKEHPRYCPVLLQVAGYNDDGTERTREQWNEIVHVIDKLRHQPILDFAYNGLTDGWDVDNYAVTMFTRSKIPTIICVSNSKNVAYNARLGALFIVNLRKSVASAMQNIVANQLIRPKYSNPCAIPAQTMSAILNDKILRKRYKREIDDIRTKLLDHNRKVLALVLGNGSDWILRKRGIFLKLRPEGFTDRQVKILKEKYAIHGPKSSRINVGGLPPDKISVIAKAYKKVLEEY